jgi:hypothetical protein
MYTIDQVRASFEKEGYKLISKVYTGYKQKLISICPNGHEYKVSFNKWEVGNRCMCKHGKMRLTIEYIQKEFEKRDCKLLSKKYISGKKLDYICPNGNKRSIRWDHFKKGKVSVFDAGKSKITIEQVRAEFAKHGYTLLSKEYKNGIQKLKYRCKRGHVHSMNRNNWMTGYRCPECQPNMKKTIEFIREEVEKIGHKLITTEYINHRQKLHTICPNGHDCFITWSNLQQGHFSGCPICKEWGTSDQEKSIVEFIKSICKNVIVHNRTLIKPYELDIILPDKKIAIEYCGLYWHSEMMGKNKNYHLNKLELCKKVGYKLITIFEDELVYKKDIVFSRLKRLLCDDFDKAKIDEEHKVSVISTQVANNFCKDKYVGSYNVKTNINLGIFCNDSLTSVMSFSLKDNVGGLIRFCSKENCNVVAEAGSLLKYFETNYNFKQLFFFADRRWQDYDLYKQIGFHFSGYTKPVYWGIKKQKRVHRSIFGELENKLKNNIIWDCGNTILIKERAHGI